MEQSNWETWTFLKLPKKVYSTLKRVLPITQGKKNKYFIIFFYKFTKKICLLFYFSPEVWKDQPYDSKSDIWSLGCVLYEITTLKPPFRAEDMEGLYKKVIRGYYPRIPTHYSQDLNNVIRALLQVAPHLRPNCGKK